jgi:hypothetical protein
MAGIEMQNAVLIALVLVVSLFLVHQYNPYFLSQILSSVGLSEGFKDGSDKPDAKKPDAMAGAKKPDAMAGAKKPDAKMAGAKKDDVAKFQDMHDGEEEKAGEGFADLSAYQGPAQFGSAEQPAGCYPREQITPSELLPKDMNSVWAEQNPMGPGSLKGKNFLSAGALIGVNTVGQSMRNANLQVRSEPPNPQQAVSIFNQSTITPDVSHRSLEIA